MDADRSVEAVQHRRATDGKDRIATAVCTCLGGGVGDHKAGEPSLARTRSAFPCCRHVPVTEAEAAAIRTAFDQGGEWAAAVELRRLFPGVTDNAEARECARTIAAWRPLPVRQDGRVARLRLGKER